MVVRLPTEAGVNKAWEVEYGCDSFLESLLVVLKYQLLARGVNISRSEDVTEVYVVYSLTVIFDLLGVAQELYLLVECLLEVLLDLVGVFSLYMVY